MAVNSTASISLTLSVTGKDEWANVVNTVNDLKASLESLAKGGAKRGSIDVLRKQLADARKEITANQQKMEDLRSTIDMMFKAIGGANTATIGLTKSQRMAAAAAANFEKELKDEEAALRRTTKATLDQEKAELRLWNATERLAGISKSNKTWWDAKQQAGLRAMAAEMKKLADSGRLIPIDKVKQFEAAIDKAEGSLSRFGAEFKTLSGRLTFFEQQMDAIFRASYRFKAVGADLQQFARSIFNTFKTLMTDFGDFDFMVRKAAVSAGIFMDTMINGMPGLKAVEEAVIGVAREARLFSAKDVAEGLYFWVTATGQTIGSLNELKATMAGLDTVMKAAAVTGVGFETTLKGVYSVITQFFGGDLNQVTDVTEKLFYVTQKTAAEFGDLINSFKMVGPVAASLGVQFEELLVVIGRLADLGIKGTMAGRAIRQVFIQLVKPSVQAMGTINAAFEGAQQSIDEFRGKSYYEMVFPEGKYVGVQQHLGILAKTLQHLNEQERNAVLARISTANSLPVLISLVNDKYREFASQTSATNKMILADAKTAFEATWASLSTGWKGVVADLQRAWESLKYTVAAGVAEAFKPFIESLAEVVDRIREWVRENPQLVETVSKLLGALAAFSAVAGVILSVTGALMGLGAAVYVAVRAFAPLAKTALGIVGIFAGLFDAVVRNADYITGTMNDAFRDLSNAMGENVNVLDGLISSVNDILEPMRGLFDIIVKVATQIAAFIIKLAALAVEFNKVIPLIDMATSLLGAIIAASVLSRLIAMVSAIKNAAVATKAWAVALALVKGQEAGAAFATMSRTALTLTENTKAATGAMGMLQSRLTAVSKVLGVGPGGMALLIGGIGLALLATLPQVQSFFAEFGRVGQKATEQIADLQERLGELGSEVVNITLKFSAEVAGDDSRVATEFQNLGAGEKFGLLYQSLNPFDPANWNMDTMSRLMFNTREHISSQIEINTIEGLNQIVKDVNDALRGWGYEGAMEESTIASIFTNLAPLLDPNTTAEELLNVTRTIASQPPTVTQRDWEEIFNSVIAPRIVGDINAARETFFNNVVNQLNQMNTINAEQARVTDLVKPMIDSLVTGMQGKTGMELQNYLATELSKTFQLEGFGDRFFTLTDLKSTTLLTEAEKDRIGQLLGTVFAEDISEIELPMNIAGDSAAQLAKQLENALSIAISDATRQATDDFSRIYPEIEKILIGGEVGMDVGRLATLLFEQPLENLGISVYEAVRTGQVSDDLKKQLVGAMQFVANELPGGKEIYQPLIDALDAKAAAGAPPEVDNGMRDWITSIKDGFISTVEGGISKSFKEIENSLRKRLNNPAKFGDAASIAKLLNQLNSKTLLYAMEQTDDSVARNMAFNYYNDNVITPLMGGIENAIAAGKTGKAKTMMQDFIKALVDVPDYFWQNLDPDARQHMLTWLKTNYAGELPPGLLADLTTGIEQGLTTAVNNVTPPKIESIWVGGVETDSKRRAPGQAKGVGTAPVFKGIIPTPAQTTAASNQISTEIQTAVTTGVNSVVGAVPGMTAQVGTNVITGIVNGIRNAAGNLNAQMNTIIASLDDGAARAYNGGYAVGSSWARGYAAGSGTVKAKLNRVLQSIDRLQHGQSPPPEGPLKDIDKGGFNAGKSWADNYVKGTGTALKGVDKHLRALRQRIAGAKNVLSRLIGLNHPNDRGYYEQEIRRQRGIVAAAERALDKYLNRKRKVDRDKDKEKARDRDRDRGKGDPGKIGDKPGTGKDRDGNGDKPGSGKETVGDKVKKHAERSRQQIQKAIDTIRRSLAGYKRRADEYRRKALEGGLNADEKRYLNQLMSDYEYMARKAKARIDRLTGKLKGAPSRPGKGREPRVGDERGNAEVVEVTKRIIQINVDVQSKDGSVTRANQQQIRKGVMDALVLAGLEHMVTVK